MTVAVTSGDELDEELGDFQFPISLSPRASTTASHHRSSMNFIHTHGRSSSASGTIPISIQHNVVLHSKATEPLIRPVAKNRTDLNVSIVERGEQRNSLNRKANSLMTVYEHGIALDDNNDDSTRRIRAPYSVNDLALQRRNDSEKIFDHQGTE